jgi:hypothetical protein
MTNLKVFTCRCNRNEVEESKDANRDGVLMDSSATGGKVIQNKKLPIWWLSSKDMSV